MKTLHSTNLRLVAVLFSLSAGLLVGCNENSTGTSDPVARATASIINTSGAAIGTANFTQEESGLVSMVVSVTGIPAGQHGIHFHMVGRAEPNTAFMSAGEHYNPDARQHGLSNPNGAHNGDLPNIEANAQGVATLTTSTNRITLTEGARTVFDADGTTLIIHTNADDQITNPGGNSGGRIAAGVLVRH